MTGIELIIGSIVLGAIGIFLSFIFKTMWFLIIDIPLALILLFCMVIISTIIILNMIRFIGEITLEIIRSIFGE